MAIVHPSSAYQWVWTTIVCVALHIIAKYIYELKSDKRGQRQSAVYAIMEFVTHPRCICLHTVVLTWHRNMQQSKNSYISNAEQHLADVHKKAECENTESYKKFNVSTVAFCLRTYSLTSIRHWLFLLLHLPLLLVASMPPFLYVYSRNMPLDSTGRRFMYAMFGDPLHYSILDLILIDYVLSYAAAWLARCCQLDCALVICAVSVCAVSASLCCVCLCCVSLTVSVCAVAIYVVTLMVLYM